MADIERRKGERRAPVSEPQQFMAGGEVFTSETQDESRRNPPAAPGAERPITLNALKNAAMRIAYAYQRDRDEGAEELRKVLDAARSPQDGWVSVETAKLALDGMKAVDSLIHFYSQREINAPANGEEAVRETRESVRAFRKGLEALNAALPAPPQRKERS